jgi:voltage-gated potassium channel Kch
MLYSNVSDPETDMFFQLGVAALLIAVTVAIQAVFMSGGMRMLKSMRSRRDPLLTSRPTLITVIWVLFLLVAVVIDVFIWATLYYSVGAVQNFEDSIYFSTVTFTTVGYGDIVLGRDFRLLATFEAVNGWIIFGWATALVMIVIQRLYMTDEGKGGG